MSAEARAILVARRRPDGATELLAPAPGVLRPPIVGARVEAGQRVATLEVLGRRIALVAPPEVDGLIAAHVDGDGAPRAVGAGDVVAVVEALEGARPRDGGRAATATRPTGVGAAALVVRAPSSGRFYRRAAPDRPPLAADGAIVEPGQPIGLLEVMKTFSRIPHEGPRARLVRVVPADGADVEAGDVLVELEPAPT